MHRIFHLTLAGFFIFASATLADETRVPMPTISKGQGEQCVEPTPIMRRDHMTFLLHQRDATVRSGIRTRKHSLIGCVQCHVKNEADGRFIPIDAPGQFCDGCHRYAAVEIDCFQCPATTPDSGSGMHSPSAGFDMEAMTALVRGSAGAAP